MITKRLTSAIAATAILTLSGLAISLQQLNIKPMSAVAQTTSCDTRTRTEYFSLRVGSTTGINLRSSPKLSARTSQNVAYNQLVDFDGWTYGESVPDLWTGQPDALWYKLKGQNLWVPSAYMVGYPPSKPPIQPSCGKFTMPEYYQRLYGHSTGASSSRGYSSSHPAIDSTDNLSPYDVRALVGGEVRTVKNGTVVSNPYDSTSGKCINNSAAYNGTVEIWNPDLQRTFTYLHFATNTIRVSPGSKVNPGDVIGTEGTTGCSTGRHTHVGVNNGATEDPLVTLANARSRGIIDKRYK